MIQIDTSWSRTSASSHNHLARYPSSKTDVFPYGDSSERKVRTYIDKEQNHLHRFVYNARVHSVDLLEYLDRFIVFPKQGKLHESIFKWRQ